MKRGDWDGKIVWVRKKYPPFWCRVFPKRVQLDWAYYASKEIISWDNYEET